MERDAFDIVLDEWRVERPDLDMEPIGIVGRLYRLGRLAEEFYQRSVEPYGLRPSDFFVLSELRRAGPPYRLSPSALCRVLVRSSGGMTKQLDQLEAEGFIQRESDPSDRRGRRVRLTASGLGLIDAALAGHIENEQLLLAKRSATARRQLATQLRRSIEDFERWLGTDGERAAGDTAE